MIITIRLSHFGKDALNGYCHTLRVEAYTSSYNNPGV